MALGSIAVYYSLAVGYYYVDEYRRAGEKKLNAFTGSLLSLFAFLLTIPSISFKAGASQVANAKLTNGVAIDRDFFSKNYSKPLIENNLLLKDMVRLRLDIKSI